MTDPALLTPSSTAPTLKYRLYLMMFLQYFIQGSYLPVITEYLKSGLNFTAQELGTFGAAISVGPLVAPFFIGQLVDRHFSTERVLSFCHLCGGILMLGLYVSDSFWPIVVLAALYSTLYIPSMMLTNSLTFHHLKDREREFPLIRLWGTIGFVVPAWWVEMSFLDGLEGAELARARAIVLLFAGVAGLLMGLYCLTLPHTPPAPQKDLAPRKVIQLLRLRHFAALVSISLVVAISHKYFFVWNSPFLRQMLDQLGMETAFEGRISSIGQIAEVLVMAGLGWSIKRFGFKTTMLAGTLAYLLRCLLFSYAITIQGATASLDVDGLSMTFVANGPAKLMLGLVFLGEALHGFCFGCFLAAAFIFVDRVSPSDVRGSMQNFYGTFIVGAGLFLGGFVGGWIGGLFETPAGAETFRQRYGIESAAGMIEFERALPDGTSQHLVTDWPGIWLSGAVIAALAMLSFAIFFPARTEEPEESTAT